LTLLNDLSPLLPATVVFSFQVDNISVDADTNIGIILDNNYYQTFTTNQCQIEKMGAGYHLLRAFLLHSSGEAYKLPSCWVECEFFVLKERVQLERGYMFGSPSVTLLSPRTDLSRAQASRLLLDFFVRNCEINEVRGFSIKVLVNSKEIGVINSWCAYELLHLPAGDVHLQLVLINPHGDEVDRPPYVYDPFRFRIALS
jgi:hypothetical protein